MPSSISKKLANYLTGDLERVGFVLDNGEIVEVENICDKPDEGFDVRGEDILLYEATATATWHTHPGGDKNLSVNDYESFRNFPHLVHYIVGTDGVQSYIVDEDGEVLIGG